MGLVPRSSEWSPDMSVFVVYAKSVSRLRAATSRAGCQAEKMRGCSSVTEAMTLNRTIFYCLWMCCCYNDPLLKPVCQVGTSYFHRLRYSWQYSQYGRPQEATRVHTAEVHSSHGEGRPTWLSNGATDSTSSLPSYKHSTC